MTGDEIKLNELKNNYRSYYKNYLLLFTIGIIWIIAAYIGTIDIQISIFTWLAGITLFKPGIYLVGKLLRTPKIYKDESLQLLTRFILLGLLLGLVIGFFPFTENINLFFPTFSIIFGIIFSIIWYTTKLKTYIILSLLLIAGGIYIGNYYPNEFSYCGYYSGFTITGWGIINGIFGRRERIYFRFLNKKIKSQVFALKLSPKRFLRFRSKKKPQQ